MKKLIGGIIIFILLLNPIHSYAGLWQLLVGMGLMCGGLFMTVDGFGIIKVEKEPVRPQMLNWDGTAYKEFEEKIKDGVEGGFGIASICLSSYLMIDYFMDSAKPKKEDSQKIYVVKNQSNIYLLWSKKF